MVTVTSLHFSPKVLMISAVCGLAPPWVSPANAPLEPPEPPEISHDLLSVTKTRAFSCATRELLSTSMLITKRYFRIEWLLLDKYVRCRLWSMERESQQNSRGTNTLVPSGPPSPTMR